MHWYKKNIGDYAKKAGRLSMLQHGAYTLLIDSCYDRERFPTMEEAIDWTWASSKEEVEAVEFVLKRFFVQDENGRFTQKRIEEELSEYREKQEKNRKVALYREYAKRERKNDRVPTNYESWEKEHDSCTERSRNDHESAPNQEPVTSNQEPITNNQQPITTKQDIADRLIDRLNKAAGKNYRKVKSNRTMIMARLDEGFSEEDCAKVIANRCKRWIGTEQEQYLRVDTLFRPKNFENYLNDNGVNHGAHQQTGGQDRPRSAPDRVAAATGQQAGGVDYESIMASHVGDLRPQVDEQLRGDPERKLGAVPDIGGAEADRDGPGGVVIEG